MLLQVQIHRYACVLRSFKIYILISCSQFQYACVLRSFKTCLLISCSQFQRCFDQWRQFHCDMRDLASWLSEAERMIQDSKRADGRLHIEKACKHQPVS